MMSLHGDQTFQTFTQKNNLQIHIKSVHEGKKFLCQQCEFKATFKVDLCR